MHLPKQTLLFFAIFLLLISVTANAALTTTAVVTVRDPMGLILVNNLPMICSVSCPLSDCFYAFSTCTSEGWYTAVVTYTHSGTNCDGSAMEGAPIVETTPETNLYYCDVTVPTITDNYPGGWINAGWTVTLDPQDATSGIKEVKYCEGAACAPNILIASPYQTPYAGEQITIVRYRAWDDPSAPSTPNPSLIGQYTVRIDMTAPSVNAGTDKTENAVFAQDATASDALSGIASYSWTKVSGPGIVSFGSPNSEDTTISTNADGTYVIRLTVVDNAGNSNFDTMSLFWDATGPVVDAGTDKVTKVQVFQDATASDATSGIASYSWTKVSGPGIVSFGTPNSEDTTISTNADGTYVIRLTVVDNLGNSNSDTMTLVWDTTPPSVNAGTDKAANAQIFQDATASDATSGIASYSWTKQSGPGTITFGTPNAEDTTISADTDGTYVIRLTVVDNAGNSNSDTMTLIKDTVNPVVTAGTDKETNIQIFQDAIASDALSGIASYSWTKDSGPGIVSFGSPNSEDTTISTNADGTYVIRLTVVDNAGNSNSDTMSLLWDATGPVVDAGTDKVTNVQIFQDAIASDALSGIASYSWTKDSGPGVVSFGTPNAEDTTISADTDGTYVIRLTVVDNVGNSNSDTMTLVWDQTPPTVDAGTDKVTNTSFFQDATASDATSGIASYSWTKFSGPGTITFGTPNAEDTTISVDTDGTYVIRLTVVDNAGNSAFDEMTLSKDIVPPVVDAGTDKVTNAQFLQDATVTDDFSGIDSYSWTMQSGPGTITFGTPNAEDTTISADTDGTYVIRLTVVDNAGNSASDEMTLVWDTFDPTTSDDYGPKDGFWQNSDQTITLTESDPIPSSGILITEYCTDTIDTCVPSIAYTIPVPISAEGITYFRYRSTDNAGNVQATVSRTVMIDKSPPVTICVGCALPNPTPAGEDTTFSPGCADTYSGCKNTTICADASCLTTYCGYDFGSSCSISTILCTYELEKPFWYYSCDNVGNCEAVAGPSIYDVKKTDGCECDASPECINDCAGGICGIWSEPSIDFELNGSGLGISSITICFGKTFRIIVTITNTNPISIDVPLHIDSFDELKNWVWFTGHRTDGHRRDLNVTVGAFETKRVSIDILGAKTGKYSMYIGPDADYKKKYAELEVKIIYKSKGIFSTTPGLGWSAFMFLLIAGLAITMRGTKRFKH